MTSPGRYVAALVAAAPPLTVEQVDTLQRVLTPPPADVTVMPRRRASALAAA